MEKLKEKNAITLIALVITIVVLIILAAVAINLSLGNNGIFNRAKTAKEQYQNAQDYEKTEVAKTTNQIDNYVGGNRASGTSGDNYSLEEHIIGTWVDGKPLYRKVIISNNITMPNNTDVSIDTSTLLNKSIIEVTNFYGGYYTDYGTNTQQFHRWTYESNNYSYTAYYRQAADCIRIRGSWGGVASYTISKAIFYIEYTKTTD